MFEITKEQMRMLQECYDMQYIGLIPKGGQFQISTVWVGVLDETDVSLLEYYARRQDPRGDEISEDAAVCRANTVLKETAYYMMGKLIEIRCQKI